MLVTCATYQSKVASSRDLLREGRATEAIDQLKPLAEEESKDQLVYLLDYATALKTAGRQPEAQKVFIKADRLADQLDYHSVSQIAAATLSSEEMLQYKGDSFEKLYLNAMSALSYLSDGNLEAALVEVRRINEKIQKIRTSGRPDYEPNPFAHYLSAVLWEADRNFDSAYIDYERAYKVDPTIPGIGADLVRAAKLARRDEAYQKWKKNFPEVVESPEWYRKDSGDLIVITEQGWGPRKQFSYADHRFPDLVPVFSETQGVQVRIAGRAPIDSKRVYDVSRASIQSFEADKAWLITRKIGAVIAKDLVADRIARENKALGVATWLFMHVSDRADLRQWSTIPQSIQFTRVRLPAGNYQVDLQGTSGDGMPTSDRLENRAVSIKSGRTQFIVWRTLR